MPDAKEKLLLEAIHFLSEKFREKFVLTGGLLLRLLNSQRATQDIDCYFLSDRSKKILAGEIKKALELFDTARLTSMDVNSRGIFITMEDKESGEKIRLEISVVPSLNLPTEPFATTAIASSHAVGARVIQVIALPEAFANKIAAIFERENTRDLYDITLLEPLCSFDEGTLKKRLKKVSIRRKKPRAFTFSEAADVLKKRMKQLTEEKLQNELYPLIPVPQQKGLLRLIQASLIRLVQKLEGE